MRCRSVGSGFFSGRIVRAGLGARLLALAALSAAMISCGGLKQVKLLTKPQEMALGEIFAQAIERQMPILKDPIIDWYLNEKGRQLAALAGGPDFPYEFEVVNTWELNAFAIPGGRITNQS